MSGSAPPSYAPDVRNTSDSSVIVALVAAAFFMENLDVTIITTALPQMARSLNVTPADLSIGVTSYLLAVAVFIPLSGWAADRFGVRTLFTSALAVFTASSVLCGMTDGLASFTAARIAQGIGGAMMVPVGRLAVLRATPKEDLMRAITLITWPGLVAPVIGPALGGFIAAYSSWRWIFYLNLPLGLVGMLLSLRFVSNAGRDTQRAFDFPGFVLCGCACTMLLYAMDLISRSVVRWHEVLVFLVVSGATAAGGFVHLRRTRNPVVDLSTFRVKTFRVALGGSSLLRIANSSLLFLLPLMFQIGFGVDAFESGLLTLWVFAGNLSMKLVTTPIMKRFGFRAVLLVNGTVNAAVLAALSFLDPATPYAWIGLVLFVSGLSRSLQATAFNTLGFADVSNLQMSAATTLSSTLNQLTIGVGVAFGSIVLRAAEWLHQHDSQAVNLNDFTLALAIIAAFSLVAIVDVFSLDRDAGAQVSGHGRRAST
ncbi:MFS transporter [Paraburkholderia sp. BR10954]|uniref:MFS transporter n=1 Tax=Paraburkholderia sp. BR10954 TaxID=3236995 RepID=UPI0034D27EAB